ncbi:hypothetical protein [Streptomyces sp. NPDC059452]|uniref:hypothetical protein n=1 Tax=Streptomyces sp. NPDC059452 TaxID=3346835 RepID=UPI00368B8DA0
MYAIKVLLIPGEPPPADIRNPLLHISGRIEETPQPGIAHVTLRAVPPHVAAMTFVVTENLLAAERLAHTAWSHWLEGPWLASWRLASCAGDLYLGVSATGTTLTPGPD